MEDRDGWDGCIVLMKTNIGFKNYIVLQRKKLEDEYW